MKPFIAAVVVVGLIGLPGTAAAQGIEGAIKGGVSFADVPKFAELIDDEDGNADMRTGLVVGGHLAFTLGGVVALQTEVLYTQKGLTASAPSGIDEELTLEVDYIDVPVLLRLGPTGRNGLQFLVGPSFNFNTAARFVVEGAFDEDEDIKDEIEDFEVGLVIGAGYYGSRVIVEGRFQEGLTDITDFGDVGEFFEDENYKNRSFQVLVGFRFH